MNKKCWKITDKTETRGYENRHGKPGTRNRGMPLALNVGLLVSAAILIAAGAAVYLFGWRSTALYNSEVKNNLDMLADTLAPQVVGALSISDNKTVAAVLNDAMSANQQIGDAIVIVKEGNKVFHDADGTREGKPFSEGMKKAGLDYVSTPIILETGFGFGLPVSKEQIGTLMIGARYDDYLKDERVRAVVAFARAMSRSIADSAQTSDYVQVRDMLGNMVGNRKNIEYAEWLNTDGSIMFYSQLGMKEKDAKEREGKKDDTPAARRALATVDRKPLFIQDITGPRGVEVLDISVPVGKDNEKLGMVRIGYSMEDFIAAQHRTKLLLAGVAAGFVLVGLVFSLIVSVRVSKPIRVLAGAARRIGAGDLEQKISIHSGGRETRELGESFNQMIIGLKERDLVKDTFSRYVTKQVAEELLRNPDKIALGGKTQNVTILFSDIRGFTNFAETHSAGEVVSQLNEYLSAMVDVIFKYEGTLDKFIGDAVMAVFGSPLPHEDDSLRAVKTAVEMQQRLKALNEKWLADGSECLSIGIGINTGEVIAGNIGDIRRMEYTVIGDNVNLASRIESLTKNYKCPIIISESTYLEVAEKVEARKLESALVKGKAKAVEIFELLGMKA